MDNRDYILTIGIDKFYLTKKERDFYLDAINHGARSIALDEDRVLGATYQSLVHKNVTEGKWRCEKDNWHSKGAECFCAAQFEELPNNTVRRIT